MKFTKQSHIQAKFATLLFEKRDGLNPLFEEAETRQDNTDLQIYAGLATFFSFSQKINIQKNQVYLTRLSYLNLNPVQELHASALQELLLPNFQAACVIYQQILTLDPEDKIALLMLETCGFLGGDYQNILPIYQKVHPFYKNNTTFAGMDAFLLCHLNQEQQALSVIQEALKKDSHNAWLQHVYMHIITEQEGPVSDIILSLENMQKDWQQQSRFFEGHNSMHLLSLKIKLKQPIENFEGFYTNHIWGAAKDMLFEQNNAFLSLYFMELNGESTPQKLWDDLAHYAASHMDNYFTPYLTITAILAVAKSDIQTAYRGLRDYQKFCQKLVKDTREFTSWFVIGLPVLLGCLAFIAHDYENAVLHLEPVIHQTKYLGHSDEQRSVFKLIYKCALIINQREEP